jgi:HEAT repeat protein
MSRAFYPLSVLIFLAILVLSSGCSIEQEPSHNNMGVSRHIDLMLKTDDDYKLDKHLTSVIEVGAAGVPWIKAAWKENLDMESRCRLASAIELIGPGAADMVPLLAEELNAIEEQRVSCAAFALGGIGPAAAPAMDQLATLLRSTDYSTQVNLLYALSRIGPDAVEHIPMMMSAIERGPTRAVAIEALSYMGEAAVDAVIPWLETGDDEHRLMACQVLARVDEGTIAKSLEPLRKALRDESSKVRIEAARALGSAGTSAIPVYQYLVHALRDTDDEAREEVIQALIRIGPVGGKELINALTDKYWRSREGAARVIGTFSSLAETAKSNLIVGLSDNNVDVRLAVIQALSVLGEEVVNDMIQQLRSNDVLQRSSGARVLAEIGPPAKSALPDLQKMLSDRDALIRAEAQKAILAISGER